LSKLILNLIENNKEVYSSMLDKVDGEGYEVLLNDGYSVDGLHAIAGDTVKDVLAQTKYIVQCPFDCVCKSW
jgi:hypothetical protein